MGGWEVKKARVFFLFPSCFVVISLEVGTSLQGYSSLSAMLHPWLLLAGINSCFLLPLSPRQGNGCPLLPVSGCLTMSCLFY